MKTKKYLYAFFAIFSILLIWTSPAFSATTSISGNLTTAKTFDRPDLSNQFTGADTTDTLVGGDLDPSHFGTAYKTEGKAYNYFSIDITPSQTGAYTIETTLGNLSPDRNTGIEIISDDTVLFLYNGFDPLNPLTGLLYANDDIATTGNYKSRISSGSATAHGTGGNGDLNEVVSDLVAGTKYTIVVTSYDNGVTGSFALSITGPAAVTVTANANTDGYNPVRTVTFDANGGSGSMVQQQANTATNLTANTFTRSGYAFAGWNTQAGGGGTAYTDSASYPFTADITLYAQWTVLPNRTVTFDANGGSGSMTAQVANVATNLTTNTFTRSGYTFAGWNTVAGGSGTGYADGASYPFSADVTLYAQWTVLPNHTVTFNANGGSGSMTAQVANVATNLTTNSFTRAGYTFTGWNTAVGGGGTAYANGASYPFTADVTLYAQWTALPNHTVTFNANGGSGSMTAQVANVATNLTTNSFTRAGYTFTGWNTAVGGGGTAYANGASYPFTADVTLYAQWTALPNHTVTFNANGGSGSMTAQVANVATNLTTNSFTRSGYTFAGWNTVAGGGGTAYTDGASYPFTADVTLYAQWTALPNRTVTFDANGGSGSMSPQTTNVATSLTANSFTRSGYTFTGWNTAAGGGGTAYADGASYPFTADVTLYAQWTPVANHTVTFNANGGSGSMTAQVANVATNLTTNSFTRSGYTFAGWNTVAGGGGTAYTNGASYPFSADVTLYAQWTVLPNHTVTFNANGGSGSMTAQVTNVATNLTANSFTRAGYTFTGWNTAAGGGGTAYADGASYPFTADVTLYAQWTAPTPTVSAINPSSGTSAGGTSVTITGTAFANGATVTIGGASASSVVFVNATTLTAVTPAGALGAGDVVVTNPSTQAGTLSNGFTYVTVVNGQCGTVAATAFMPSSGLCTQGTASAVTAGSPWSWSCNGSGAGHTNASCTAPNQTTSTGTGTGYALLSATNNWTLDPASTGFTAAPASAPPGYSLPHGVLAMRLVTGTPNSDATVTINYPNPLPAGTVYWKYGRRSSAPVAQWYQMPANKAVISADRLSITLTLTDNGDGDDDYTTNSVIVDPGGPGVLSSSSGATSIPTLSQWGQIILSLLLALLCSVFLVNLRIQGAQSS